MIGLRCVHFFMLFTFHVRSSILNRKHEGSGILQKTTSKATLASLATGSSGIPVRAFIAVIRSCFMNRIEK